MTKALSRQKGIALVIVLATLFIVIILANVVLNIIVSQFRITHHQVSRIQAYYAAMAGVNLAYDNLRRGAWPLPAPGDSDSYPLNETGLPNSVTGVTILVADHDFPGCNPPDNLGACISATSNYIYTP